MKFIQTFFKRLNQKNVRYCHWKSNSHLDAALKGETDLDLLIHVKDKKTFDAICAQHNFKRIISPPEKQYPGMEDYLGYDERTGISYHLHVHYKLILGEQGVKNYHIPIEKFVLDNTTWSGAVRIPRAEVEFLLLLIRMGLKCKSTDVVRGVLKQDVFPKDIRSEFKALHKKISQKRFVEILQQSKIPFTQEEVNFIIRAYRGADALLIIHTRIILARVLNRYRRFNVHLCNFRIFRHFLRSNALASKFFKRRKKTLARGRFIALIGADGSGKSTLAKHLMKWLGWKLEIRSVYLGNPKWHPGMKVLSFIRNLFGGAAYHSPRPIKDVLGFFRDCFTVGYWLHAARIRRAEVQKALHYAQKGYVIFSDRYPLKVFHSMHQPIDGPRLGLVSDGFPFITAFREYEKRIYAEIPLPHHIIALAVTFENARKRKKDIEASLQRTKVGAVQKLKPSKLLTKVNANKSFDEVSRAVRKKIWEVL